LVLNTRDWFFTHLEETVEVTAGGGKELGDKRPPCRYIYQDSVRKYYQMRKFTK